MNTPTPERMSPARVAAITRRINRLEREAAALRASIPVAQRKPHRAERDGVVVVAVFAGRLMDRSDSTDDETEQETDL